MISMHAIALIRMQHAQYEKLALPRKRIDEALGLLRIALNRWVGFKCFPKLGPFIFYLSCGWSLSRIHFVCGHMFAAPVRITKICGIRTGAQISVCGPKAHSPVRNFEKSAPVGDILVLGCTATTTTTAYYYNY